MTDPWEKAYFTAMCAFCGLVAWGILCRDSLAKRRLTIADLLALLFYLGVMLGIASYF